MHDVHVPQGSPSTGDSQLSALARMRAEDVLPVPRGPLKRYACETRSSRTALRSARTTWSWPLSSSNRPGRKRRYNETKGASAMAAEPTHALRQHVPVLGTAARLATAPGQTR